MEMATTAAKLYVATTAAKYAWDPALLHIGPTTMRGTVIAATAMTELAKYTVVWIVHHMGYLFRYKRNVNDLKNKVQNDLLWLENDVKGLINLARDNDLQNKVRNDPERLKNDVKGKVDSSTKKEHFNAFASRESTKKEVIQALMDDKTNLVGVYGMGGVGKPTLMKEILKQNKDTKLFDKVVLATVSQNPDLRGIQTQIAESLGMRIEEESIQARATTLSAMLEQQKNILLILDDLWKRLELDDVGINLSGVGQNICKVLITSRSLEEVGDVDFDAKRESSEEIVNECGGLPLAIVTLGRTLRTKSEGVWADIIQQLQISVYEGLDCVNVSLRLSYDFLKSSKTKQCFLLCSLFPEDQEITMDALVGYAMGEDLLGDAETLREARRNLHIMVDTLVYSGLLLKGDNDGYIMMHDIVRDVAISITSENENESIIKAGVGLTKWPKQKEPGRCLRMSLMSNHICEVPDAPQFSRLLTLSLAKNRSLKNIPNGFFESMKLLETLDSSDIRISSLPQSLASLANSLRTLYLEKCIKLQDVSLIGNLKTLEILSLSGTRILRLPEEIRGLTNLKMLDLSYNMSLKSIPPNVISNLTRLEELYMSKSFRGWEIEGAGDDRCNASLVEVASLAKLSSLCIDIENEKWLSTDIGPCHWEKLTKFIVNDFHYNFTVTTINVYDYERRMALSTGNCSYPLADWVNVLIERTHRLHLDYCHSLKNVVQLNPKGFNNLKSLFIELVNIEYLVSMEDEERVPVVMFTQLEILKFSIMGALKTIWNGLLPKWSFENLQVLHLHRCSNLVSILPSRLWARLKNLEEIDIYDCRNLKEVFDSYGAGEGRNSIAKLRKIKLQHLSKLTSIWKGAIPLIRFENIKVVDLAFCPSLRSLNLFFSLAFAQRFEQLEEVTVSGCDILTKLIAKEDEEEGKIDEVTVAKSSPSSMYHPVPSIDVGSRKLVSSSFTVLPQPQIFSSLKKIDVSFCDRLKFIFPIRILRCLLQLEEFKVEECFIMEELTEEGQEEEVEEEGNMTICLPHLRLLYLRNLPCLSTFFSHRTRLPHILLECPSLENLTIVECLRLKRLPFGLQSTSMLTNFIIDDNEWFEGLEWVHLSVKSQLLATLEMLSVCPNHFENQEDYNYMPDENQEN
ncbi:hypothetical protein GIB67_041431 [Kingdonia uniflora]|uniref:AAA+ ATPase domain-containing protein n=1 Tax=Kingdonia uniflora TaxID=39325 RepID=A0A7J7LRG0_9MAGN|nr:hypothetical protein GIB67_041431 [Kingdonia uniflora]